MHIGKTSVILIIFILFVSHMAFADFDGNYTETKEKPMLALIIDDAGRFKNIIRKFFELDKAITVSILPFSPNGLSLAHEAKEKGVEVMLHFPMEPIGYPETDPGKNALLSSMSYEIFHKTVNEVLDTIPHIKGVNNHMGSYLTTLALQMDWLFVELKKKNLFFIDSKTTSKSICKYRAKLRDISFAENRSFIDHIPTEEAIVKQISVLLKFAKKTGKAIGIGHPKEITYKVLYRELPNIKKEVRLVPVSSIMEGKK